MAILLPDGTPARTPPKRSIADFFRFSLEFLKDRRFWFIEAGPVALCATGIGAVSGAVGGLVAGWAALALALGTFYRFSERNPSLTLANIAWALSMAGAIPAAFFVGANFGGAQVVQVKKENPILRMNLIQYDDGAYVLLRDGQKGPLAQVYWLMKNVGESIARNIEIRMDPVSIDGRKGLLFEACEIEEQ